MNPAQKARLDKMDIPPYQKRLMREHAKGNWTYMHINSMLRQLKMGKPVSQAKEHVLTTIGV